MGRHVGKDRPVTEPPYYCHFFNTVQQETINTAIAGISAFQQTNMPANTAFADVADISEMWATMGRHMSARAAPGAPGTQRQPRRGLLGRAVLPGPR